MFGTSRLTLLNVIVFGCSHGDDLAGHRANLVHPLDVRG
jgi:hypothetical protein